MSQPKYAIGIDLGTTHSALSWVDLHTEGAAPEILPVAQQSGPGAVQDYSLLPSFLYVPHDSEFAPGDLALPWNAAPGRITGEWARSHGALTPIRLVSSAKSWLGHAGVDRRAGILPADAPPEVERISPLAASTHYLQHLRDAWNHRHPEAPFDQQSVTVTIPASFDPAARELTAEAAQAAGYHGITLLEEPQAALYSWIAGSAGDWRKQVQVGDVILVVDVGAAPATSRSSPSPKTPATCSSTAWPWASTSCSAATTWTWPSPTASRAAWPPKANSSTPGRCARSPTPAAWPRSSC